MRRVRDLMQQLGFREEGSDRVKQAFVKNLYRSAYGKDLVDVPRRAESHTSDAKKIGEQLTFDVSLLGPNSDKPGKKKTG